MPGLVPGIHVIPRALDDVDGRDKPGHDDVEAEERYTWSAIWGALFLPRLLGSIIMNEATVVTGLAPIEDLGGKAQPLLRVDGLTKHFPVRGGLFGARKTVRAVDDVSFNIGKGETVGIVGESGCGKSTTARLLMHLMDRDAGEIIFDGRQVGHEMSLRELRRGMQMVFQDSYASLNPRLTIEESIAFGPKVHGMADTAARALARELLGKVGLRPETFANRYPHEISGGQRQRVNIARALALSPRLVILDEAVSALDKSVEAQVLNLLMDLKREFGLTYLFISHDLNVINYISDRVLVMYLGEVVELGPVEQVWAKPAHPYTRALLAAMPSSDPDKRTEVPPLSGDPPNPIDPPAGCRFHTRCPFVEAPCSNVAPKLTALDTMGHQAACHMAIPGSGHSRAPAA
ncbi:dipeptide/oligopeptide/nickel ABC transporter ATP-binding protein [Bradyrhizobium sp. SSBR45G]|nr:dipeptide/oligopeptide/nickel ABC transporter ATP-binding protein [Bradyrhizobium sp. SSBR45G]GLH84777.1 dipeptide/oligopeptide/nickel ABC transporter ATP-binding protein [Bradyrhizobium sp. SSBR45R]